jgi:diguanylate cyclase (GGDEF)-like protein
MNKSQQEAEETVIKMTKISKLLKKDIAKRKKVEEKLQILATTDPLTGLYNRRHFRKLALLELSRAQRYKKNISLLMIDIDHFKRINDNYGHTTGDKGLKALSNLFADTLRDIDTMARYGGEEFVILLPETGKSAALMVAERLRRDVEEMIIETDPASFTFTISIGISNLNIVNAVSIETLLDQADKALYASKQTGRNRVTAWEAIF